LSGPDHNGDTIFQAHVSSLPQSDTVSVFAARLNYQA